MLGKFVKSLTTVGLAAGLLACGGAMASAAPNPEPKVETYIVGGTRADWNTVSYATQLNYGGDLQCSASLIGPSWVLTAKHCVEDDPAATAYSVNVGSHLLGEGRNVPVSNVYTWDQGDVALVELATPQQGRYGKLGADRPTPGTVGDIYGWGTTSLGGPASPVLKTAWVQITGSDTNGWPGPATILKGLDGQALHGDSGGPLVVNGKIVGVGAGFANDAQSSTMGERNGTLEYASVPAAATWITATTGIPTT